MQEILLLSFNEYCIARQRNTRAQIKSLTVNGYRPVCKVVWYYGHALDCLASVMRELSISDKMLEDIQWLYSENIDFNVFDKDCAIFLYDEGDAARFKLTCL